MPEVSVLIEGGKATAAAPLGPALGPLGVNIAEIVKQINEKTRDFSGMKVPVKIAIDSSTKGFSISVGSPPTSALIKRELGIEKGAANPRAEVKGNLTMQQVIKIAGMKSESLASYRLKAAASEVIGTCNAMGINIEGKRAKIVQKELHDGNYDPMFAEKAAGG